MDELADRYPPLNGGALCLDFANTLEPDVGSGSARDHLAGNRRQPDGSGLLAWLRYADLLTGDEDDPTPSGAALAQTAVELRADVDTIFAAVAQGRSIPPDALDRLRLRYAGAVEAAGSLRQHAGTVSWDWSTGNSPARALGVIAASAVDLLTSDRLARVKQCDGPSCFVLFVDATKNGSRRWCQMRYCGNVSKGRRQAAQRRQERARRARPGAAT